MKRRASVVMASYNGEKYIREQIDSILKNLGPDDELIVSDDGSIDGTREIVCQYHDQDDRVILIKGPGKGVKQNFAKGIIAATGKYIFLTDQDDVWKSNKLDKCIAALEDGYMCVLHNASIVDENLKNMGITCFESKKSKTGRLNNIIRNSYMGCCMAFNAKIKPAILPVPDNIEMHDQWIGIISERFGKTKLIDECLILYRRHGGNVSGMQHYGVWKMILNRVRLVINLLSNHKKPEDTNND